MGVDIGDVVVAVPDTARVPNSGPTVASRTAMVVGRLIERACDDLRRRLDLDEEAAGRAVTDAIVGWHRAHPGESVSLSVDSLHVEIEAPPDVGPGDCKPTRDLHATRL